MKKTFNGVTVQWDGSITFGDEWQNTSRVHAEVETTGEVLERSTVTRVVAGAVIAGPVGLLLGGLLRKRTDLRDRVLLITGEHDWVVPVAQHQVKQAHEFTRLINAQAREWSAKESAANSARK